MISSPKKSLVGFLRLRHGDGTAVAVWPAQVAGDFMVPMSSQADWVVLTVYNADDKDLTVVLDEAGENEHFIEQFRRKGK